MKKLLLKSMLLLCALIVGSSSVWADDYELYSGDITEGDYVIVYSGVAMKNTESSSRLGYQSVTISENKISSPGAAIVWHIAASGDYWTIYNVNVSKYAASTGAKNKAQLLESGTDDMSLWSVTGTESYEFVNKKNDANGVNKNLRYNVGYGFACYATGTGGPLRLYKKAEAAGEATTVTINSSEITNTNKYLGTAAGTLTAAVTVTSTSAAVAGATVTWSSSNTSVATVGETTGVVTLVGEGSTTITASYAGKTGVYKSSSAEYVLNVTNENPNAITLWSEDFSGYSANNVPTGGTYSYTCDNGGGTTKIYEDTYAGGTSPELLVAKTNGYFQAVVPLENILGDLKLTFKKGGNALSVSTSTEGISISGTSSFSDAGEFTVTFTGVKTNMTSVTIKFTSTSGSNVRIDDIVLKGSKVVPATITAAEYATFNSSYALDFSETGITVYTATDNETSVALNEIVSGKVPANTPVVLYKAGADGTAINVPVIASATAIEGTNDLNVSDGTTTLTNAYVLANKTQGVGFYPWGGTTLSAGKVYLQGKGSYAAREFLGLGDATTIENVAKIQTVDAQYFNLAGQRVAQPTRGLYIVNGKKVIIK